MVIKGLSQLFCVSTAALALLEVGCFSGPVLLCFWTEEYLSLKICPFSPSLKLLKIQMPQRVLECVLYDLLPGEEKSEVLA